jgi:hypothetical protein
LPGRWRPGKHEIFHFIAAFLDRILWTKQSIAKFVECLKLLNAIKVVEKVLKTFLSPPIQRNGPMKIPGM